MTVDGQTLTADHGSFSGTGPLDYTYQWQRCDADGTNCVDLPGATGSTYDLVSSDVGGAVRVIVTATNGAGSDSATSSATTEVLALAPTNVTPPSISGTPLDGHTLTVDPGTWSGTQPIDFGYQWQRCDADGSGCSTSSAPRRTYTLVPGDIDHVIQVAVTATNVGGSAQSGSAQTAPAQAAPPAQHRRPGRQRHARGRLDAERHDRQLERHRPDRLRVPVAALRRRRHALRRHRRGDRLDLRPHARRRRPRDRGRGHRDQRRRR